MLTHRGKKPYITKSRRRHGPVPCSFDAAGGASVEANNEAVCVLSGVGGADILMAEWTNGVGRPCHYVAVDRASRQIVLSVRYAFLPATILSLIDTTCPLQDVLAEQAQMLPSMPP